VKIETTALAANLVIEGSNKAKKAETSTAAAGPSVITNLNKNLTSDSDEINMDKVNEIKLAIAEGRLKIDPDRIAAALIKSSREFL
jgi:negative regulator of flagellin synthesis FlgM